MSEERKIVGRPVIMARLAKGGFLHEHEIEIDGQRTGILMATSRQSRNGETSRKVVFDGKEYPNPKDAIAAYDAKKAGTEC